MAEFFVCPRGALPAYSAIMTFLWGDRYTVADPEEEPHAWEEGTPLEFELPGPPRVVAWPGRPPGVRVKSADERLAARLAYFLAVESGGSVADRSDGPFAPPTSLVPRMGAGFSVEAAAGRVRLLRKRLPRFFEHHLGFLAQHVPGELANVLLHDGARSIKGRCTHPRLPLPLWVGMGPERWSAFAAAEPLPEDFFACLLAGYTHQEWAFVLWRRGQRRLWFGSPFAHVYDQGRNPARTAGEMQEALHEWSESEQDVFFMGGIGKLQPKQPPPQGGGPH